MNNFKLQEFLSIESTTPLQTVVTPIQQVQAVLTGDNVTDVLQQVFGYSSFQPGQEETIRTILDGSDTFVVMPTGGGKILCYAIPAIISKGLTIVVTPLLALMDDQVRRLRAKKINVCYINSRMTEQEKDVVIHCLSQQECPYDILLITPEALVSPQFQAVVMKMSGTGNLSRIIVDEAHCVDTWGNDFRQSYSQLSMFKDHRIQMVAFTGTATDITVQRIIESLQLDCPHTVRVSLERPNLSFTVAEKRESKSMENIADNIVKEYSGKCGIVYCFSTRDTLDMAYNLKRRGIKAVYYHGQLDLFEKDSNATMWLESRADVICATNAFGMGIDKKDVRFVIHHSMPKSMEEYFQEAGRAGRDGNPAHCTLFFRFQDRVKHLKHISEIEHGSNRTCAKKRLDGITKFCIGKECRKQAMLQYFNDHNHTGPCQVCDACINSSEQLTDMTETANDLINCALEILAMQPKVSSKYIILVYRGHKTKEIVTKGLHTLPSFGKGKGVFKNDKGALKLLHLLISMGFLIENLSLAENQSTPFITVDENYQLQFSDGSIVIKM